jgi:hypothetical protein
LTHDPDSFDQVVNGVYPLTAVSSLKIIKGVLGSLIVVILLLKSSGL